MDREIFSIKLLCKSGSSVSSGMGCPWTPLFIKGNWYDCMYRKWRSEESKRLNGGYLGDKFWVIAENGEEREMSIPEMNIIFGIREDDIRNHKISQIID